MVEPNPSKKKKSSKHGEFSPTSGEFFSNIWVATTQHGIFSPRLEIKQRKQIKQGSPVKVGSRKAIKSHPMPRKKRGKLRETQVSPSASCCWYHLGLQILRLLRFVLFVVFVALKPWNASRPLDALKRLWRFQSYTLPEKKTKQQSLLDLAKKCKKKKHVFFQPPKS